MLILKFLIHRPLTHFRSLQTTWLKICWLQLDSNSVCRSRRLARWPPRPISNFTIALHKKKAPILNGHLRLLNHKSCWIQNDKSLTLGFTTTQSVRPDGKIFFKFWLFGPRPKMIIYLIIWICLQLLIVVCFQNNLQIPR